MDVDLRNGLWNAVYMSFLDDDDYRNHGQQWTWAKHVWVLYLKRPLQDLPQDWTDVTEAFRKYFLDDARWNQCYDFIEVLAQIEADVAAKKKFIDLCTIFLESEASAFRFVGNRITKITSEQEIKGIEEALTVSEPISDVKRHLAASLELLSDRKSPKYRNSIKESISAVEAMCRLIVGSSNADLSEALKEIEKHIEFHGALKTALIKLYAYTSDAEGIRHALSEEPTLDFEDAKFMLVTCSAFINYLIVKADKAAIPLT